MANKAQKIDINEEFISRWHEQPSLWDCSSASYRDKYAKAQAYQYMADVFEMTEDDVRAKINALRSYFTKELTKVVTNNNGASGDKPYVTKWQHFSSLNFLRNTIRPRNITTMVHINGTGDTTDENANKSNDFQVQRNDGSIDKLFKENEDDSFRNEKFSIKRLRSKMEVEGLEEPTIPLSKKPKMDAEDIFGQHVAFSLRNVQNNKSKEFAKFKIQEILFQSQFDLLDIPVVP